jgi:hypothetical protein
MKRLVVSVAGAAVGLVMLSPDSAIAGPYSDDLAKCLVKSTTDADKNSLVKWMFAAASLHPAVKSIASVSDAERDDLNKNAAKLFERLVTESCRAETQEAVKYEGPSTIQTSFEVLGQVAGRGLLADPAVARSLADFANYLDKKKLEQLLGPPGNTK